MLDFDAFALDGRNFVETFFCDGGSALLLMHFGLFDLFCPPRHLVFDALALVVNAFDVGREEARLRLKKVASEL